MTTLEWGGPTAAAITIDELVLPATLTDAARVERRRDAALALDPLVRRVLADAAVRLPAPTIEATIYDAIYPANPEAGAHWTAASLLLGPLSHAVWSYTITLLFDEHDRPRRFAVEAAREALSADCSETALREAIDAVRPRGPLQTFAANFFPSLGL